MESDKTRSSVKSPIEFTVEGSLLLVVRSRKEPIQEWLETIREKSGQNVDASYPGGNAYIFGQGNIEKIYTAIKENLVELNARINACNQSKYKLTEPVNYTAEFIDECIKHYSPAQPLKVKYYPGT